MNHPTVVVRREVYERHGPFDPACKYAMDFEFLLRITLGGVRGTYSPKICGNMQTGGASDAGSHQGIVECMRIVIAHGRPRLIAAAECLFYATRIRLRVWTECHLPPRLAQLLREWSNPTFRGPKAGGVR